MTWFQITLAISVALAVVTVRRLPNDCITLAWRHLRGSSAPRPAPVEIEADAG